MSEEQRAVDEIIAAENRINEIETSLFIWEEKYSEFEGEPQVLAIIEQKIDDLQSELSDLQRLAYGHE